jgi:hypothetical protein
VSKDETKKVVEKKKLPKITDPFITDAKIPGKKKQTGLALFKSLTFCSIAKPI